MKKKKKKKKEVTRKHLEVTDMLITQIALIVSQVYVCVQIHQNARIKHVQFLIYQLYPNKADMRRYRFLELEKLCIF